MSLYPGTPTPDGLPLPSEVIANNNTTNKCGPNRTLKSSVVRQLNIRLRGHGLVIKRVVPPDIAPTTSIQGSSDFAEYEVSSLMGGGKNVILNKLLEAAEGDKAEKGLREEIEKEEREEDWETGEEDSVENDGEDEKTPVAGGEDKEGSVDGEKRKGEGPPLGIFFEEVLPDSIVRN